MAKKLSIVALFIFMIVLTSSFIIFVNGRIYVPAGHSLVLRYKGPVFPWDGKAKKSSNSSFAKDGEIGMREKMLGEGAHYYSQIWWERIIVPNTIIKPGEVGIVLSKIGEDQPHGKFLVEGDFGKTNFKGVLRKVLTPGAYRVHPYGYEVTIVKNEVQKIGMSERHTGWVEVPVGCVGVVTNLTDNPQLNQFSGIQDNVLPPGLYQVNPKESYVDIVRIGYWETSIDMQLDTPFDELMLAEDRQEEKVDKEITGGIRFPSNDGFPITIDFAAVWGLMPNQAPNAIRMFGNVDLIESKIVVPQIASIFANNGSEHSAYNLIAGKERESYQNEGIEELREVLGSKDITLQYGTIKHIYIPNTVRQPIQMVFISELIKSVRGQESLATEQEGLLKEAEKMVEYAKVKVDEETKVKIAKERAKAEKLIEKEIAVSKREIAAIEARTSILEATSKLLMETAKNEGQKLIEEAKSRKFKLAVDVFGNPKAYNEWEFASDLPDDIDINMFYAGPGTMWTDMKTIMSVSPDSAEKKNHAQDISIDDTKSQVPQGEKR